MLQVFTDQMRDAYQENGGRGVFSVWVRTLWDLGVSALKEQFSSPHLTQGLLEAVPNAPLPWKGVALVLVPGLIFFIAQIAQLSGQDLFFLMVYRAGYFLIIPVLLVWWWKRKFPVWGLVPLGLFFRTVWDFSYRILLLEFPFSNPLWFWLLRLEKQYSDEIKIGLMVGIALVALLLVILVSRRQHVRWSAWLWMGVYLLLCVSYLAANYWFYVYNETYPVDPKQFMMEVAPSFIFDNVGFLLLILVGAFFAKRYGRLAMLVAVGFLLPAVLYGRIGDYWEGISEQALNAYLLLISISVLVYRFVIALAAPLWVVRSASDQSQRKASLVTLLVALGIQAALNIGGGVFMGLYYQYTGWVWVQWYNTVATELIAAAGVVLASSLYGNAASTQSRYDMEQLAVDAT
jgi:hypothetical protein